MVPRDMLGNTSLVIIFDLRTDFSTKSTSTSAVLEGNLISRSTSVSLCSSQLSNSVGGGLHSSLQEMCNFFSSRRDLIPASHSQDVIGGSKPKALLLTLSDWRLRCICRN